MKTVKIFISSTFRDMNAERDYLNEHVFPRLKEKARERFSIEIEPIDLRWGVTEEDALKGRALEICLETIDECRPFFLCMLGKRYGWVPPLNEIKASDFNDLVSSYDLGPDEKEFVKKHYHLQSFNHDAMLYELSIQVGSQPERYIDESIIMGSEVLKIIKTVSNLHYMSSMPIKDIKSKEMVLKVYMYNVHFEKYLNIIEKGYVEDNSGIFIFDPKMLTTEEKAFADKYLNYFEYYKKVFSYIQGQIGSRLQQCLEKAHVPGASESITEKEIRHAVLNNELPIKLKELEDIISDLMKKHMMTPEDEVFLRHCYPGNRLLKDLSNEELGKLISLLSKVGSIQNVRSLFFFREDVGEDSAAYTESDEKMQRTLEKLKCDIRQFVSSSKDDAKVMHKWMSYPCSWDRESCRIDGLEAFGEMVYRELWAGLEEEHGSTGSVDTPVMSEDERIILREDRAHESFVDSRTKSFIGREKLLKKIDDTVWSVFMDENIHASSPYVMVAGAPGGGKSAALSKFYIDFREAHAHDVFVLPHFTGAGLYSTSPAMILKRLCRNLKKAFSFNDDIPFVFEDLQKTFLDMLKKVPKRVLIIIDAINQVDKTVSGGELEWLPKTLPEKVCILLSSVSRPDAACAGISIQQDEAGRKEDYEVYDSFMARLRKPHLIVVPGLEADERERLVAGYLARFRKVLEKDVLYHITKKAESHNPLYLTVAAEELRLYGSFDTIRDYAEKLPEKIVDMFSHVFSRLERSFRGSLVEDLLTFVSAGRDGMHKEDIKNLIKLKTGEAVDDYIWSDLTANLNAYMTENEGVYRFFHQQVKEAAVRRYLSSDEKKRYVHRFAADYLISSGFRHLMTIRELPWQLSKAGEYGLLRKLLWDYSFIKAKVDGKMSIDLIDDFDSIADDTNGGRLSRLLQSSLRLSVHVISEHPEDLPVQLTGRLTGRKEEEFLHFIEDMRTATDTLWFRPLKSCLTSPGGPVLRTLSGHSEYVKDISISRDDRLLVSASSDKTLKVWDLKNHTELLTLRGHTSWVNAVMITNDGRFAISGSYDKTVRLWDVESGKLICTLEGHNAEIMNVCISEDGRLGASASYDGVIKIWDLKAQKERFSISAHSSIIYGLNITADGRFIISSSFGERTVKLWDTEKGREIRILEGHTDSVIYLCISDDGKLGASASGDKTIKIWDLESGTVLRTLSGHQDIVRRVSLTHDWKFAVSVSGDNVLKVWDVEKGRELRSFAGRSFNINTAKIAQDGRHVVSCGDSTIKIWDTWNTEEEVQDQEEHSKKVTCVTVTDDGRYVLSSSYDNTVRVWNAIDHTLIRKLTGHTHNVKGISVSADGTTLVSGAGDGTLKVWDITLGRELGTFKGHKGDVQSVKISPDGRFALSSSSDNTIKLWDLSACTELMTMEGHQNIVCSVDMTPDGRLAVSSSVDLMIKIWDLKNGTELRTLKGHFFFAGDIRITPDGRYLISASGDNTLKVWDIRSGKDLFTMRGHQGDVYGVGISPDGRFALSASRDGTIRLWDIAKGTLTYTFNGESRYNCCHITQNGLVVAGDDDHSVHYFQLENMDKIQGIKSGVPRVTAVRLWLREAELCGGASQGAGLGISGSFGASGHWDDHLTVLCPWCGIRHDADAVASIIAEIEYANGGIMNRDAPCISLHDDAWDDARLNRFCPNCGKPLKFNPFVVDNR